MSIKRKTIETFASEKVIKAIGQAVKEELDTLGPDDLKTVIINAHESMAEVKEKLDANPVYHDLKRRVADVTQGKKDVDKYQKGKIAYARLRLKEMGKLERFDLEQVVDALREDRRTLLERRTQALMNAKEPPLPRCQECGAEKRNVAEKGEEAVFECYRCETLPRIHEEGSAK